MFVSLLLGKPDISFLANMLCMPLISSHMNLYKDQPTWGTSCIKKKIKHNTDSIV